MHKLPAVLVWATALINIAIGVFFLVAPDRAAATVGLTLTDPVARVDVRATYGGMVLGIGVLFAVLAQHAEWVRPGLWGVALVCGGLASGRILGILAGGGTVPMMWGFLALELTVTAMAGWLLLGSGA